MSSSIADLDREIAEALAVFRDLEERAKTDPIAALVLRKVTAIAERIADDWWTGSPGLPDGLASLIP